MNLLQPFPQKIRLLGLMAALLPLGAQAGLVVGSILDKTGQGVPEAVVYATPVDGTVPAAAASETIQMTQENYLFVPYVSVIRKGTAVKFTNRDARDHHIKSFSLTKAFEMRVPAKGEAAQPVLFDKVGDVVLVCHFHDAMRGFIFVTDTPYYAKTDKGGNALLSNLPAGKYQLQAWVPNMISPLATQIVQINESGSAAVNFKLDFVPKAPPVGRTPKAPWPNSGPSYGPGS